MGSSRASTNVEVNRLFDIKMKHKVSECDVAPFAGGNKFNPFVESAIKFWQTVPEF